MILWLIRTNKSYYKLFQTDNLYLYSFYSIVLWIRVLSTELSSITKEHQVNDTITERPDDWVAYYVPMWETAGSKVPIKDLSFLLTNYTDPTHGYGLAIDHSYRGGKIVQLLGDGQNIPNQMESIIFNVVEWLSPKPKARIAYDLSHSPRLCVDSWDSQYGSMWDEKINFGQLRNSLVNHSYIVDKLYPRASGNFTAARLAHYDMVIVVWPNLNFTVDEQQAIESWISTGGSLLLLGDRANLGGIGKDALNYLLDDFSIKLMNVDTLNDVYADQRGPHPTLEECSSNLNISYRNYIHLEGGQTTSLWNEIGQSVVAAQQYKQGRIILTSDMNIFDGVRLPDASNYRFAINVVNWLTSATADILVYSSNDIGVNLHRVEMAKALNQLDVRYYLTATPTYQK